MTSAMLKDGGSNPDPFWDVIKPIQHDQARDDANPYVADVLALSDHLVSRTYEADSALTEGVLLWALSEKHHTKWLTTAPVFLGEAVKPEARTEAAEIVGFSLYYRAWWLLLAIAGAVWGGLVGASLAGAFAMGVVTTVVGTVVLAGLMATLFVAGRRTSHNDG